MFKFRLDTNKIVRESLSGLGTTWRSHQTLIATNSQALLVSGLKMTRKRREAKWWALMAGRCSCLHHRTHETMAAADASHASESRERDSRIPLIWRFRYLLEIQPLHRSAPKPCLCMHEFQIICAGSAEIYQFQVSFVWSERIQRGFFKKILDWGMIHIVIDSFARARMHLFKGCFSLLVWFRQHPSLDFLATPALKVPIGFE